MNDCTCEVIDLSTYADGPATRLARLQGHPDCPVHRTDTGTYRVVDLEPVGEDDEECTRCGVRQDFLGLCGDCVHDDGTPNPCADGTCTGNWNCPRECPPLGCSCSVNEPDRQCQYCEAVTEALADPWPERPDDYVRVITEQKERGEDPAGGIFAAVRRWARTIRDVLRDTSGAGPG